MLMLMEATDESVYRLADEQVAQVRRRIARPERKLLSRAEASERICDLAIVMTARSPDVAALIVRGGQKPMYRCLNGILPRTS